MADADTTPANLLFLAAANPALTATPDPIWNERRAEWLRLDALARADIDFGAHAKADHEHSWTMARIRRQFGQHSYRLHPDGMAQAAAAMDVMTAADEVRSATFLKPMWKAAVELALTPAPSLTAAMFKVELIKREELDNCTSMPRDPFEVIAEDMAGLAHGQEAA